jgi:hypothetical protein
MAIQIRPSAYARPGDRMVEGKRRDDLVRAGVDAHQRCRRARADPGGRRDGGGELRIGPHGKIKITCKYGAARAAAAGTPTWGQVLGTDSIEARPMAPYK